MCETKHIKNLFAAIPSHHITPLHTEAKVIISMKRSDGELFNVVIKLESEYDANKIKEIINYVEELRTCSCTKFTVCEKHSDLRKL